jgi:uncharacterized protein YmfQ (DUF2313 family)
MKFHLSRISLALAAAGAILAAPGVATAADKAGDAARSGAVATSDRMSTSDRANARAVDAERDRLQAELKAGQPKSFYPQALNERGYTVTSINSDSAESVEYEVVKGNRSYEVHVDFDNGGRATEVDVTPNIWRTEATKAALGGKTVPVATRVEKGNEAYRDRARMKTWDNEKERLEKSLALGQDKAYYDQQLRKLGYQVTSVNDAEKDYVEYEVVKGGDSFEVQVDFENNKARKVDVTTNVWQSEATERALTSGQR